MAAQPGADGVHSLLGLTAAIPILLGDNIGTTITAVLAAIGQGRDAIIAKVLRPSEHIKISKIEKDPNKLESLYQLGLRDAKRLLADKQGMEKQ